MHTLSPEIRNQLPEFSKHPPNKPLTKNFEFYSNPNNDISWNNKFRTGRKQYQFFHKQLDDKQSIIDQIKDQQIQDLRNEEEMRIIRANAGKADVQERTRSRKNERVFLQIKSQQQLHSPNEALTLQNFGWLSQPTDVKLYKTAISAKHVARTDNKWNYILEADQKFVDQLVRPISVKREEEFHSNMQNKLEGERCIHDLQRKAFEQRHDEIRNSFLARHDKNYDFEKKCKLIPEDDTKKMTVRPSTSASNLGVIKTLSSPASRNLSPKSLFNVEYSTPKKSRSHIFNQNIKTTEIEKEHKIKDQTANLKSSTTVLNPTGMTKISSDEKNSTFRSKFNTMSPTLVNSNSAESQLFTRLSEPKVVKLKYNEYL